VSEREGEREDEAERVARLNEFTRDRHPGHCGVEVLTCNEQEVTGRLDVRPDLVAGTGYLWAPVVVTLADWLCAAGTPLHSPPEAVGFTTIELKSNFLGTVQAGAELFGAASLAADVEIINLMLATLAAAGLDGAVTLDLGHGDVCGALLAQLALPAAVEAAVFDALQRKSRPDLEAVLAEAGPRALDALSALLNLHGDASVLDRAARELVPLAPAVGDALETLRAVAAQVSAHHPGIDVYFDLAELRGYHYHTGIVFAAYLPRHGEAVANGGRYDNVARGRSRAARGRQ